MKKEVIRQQNAEIRDYVDRECCGWSKEERRRVAKERLRQYLLLEEAQPGITERILHLGDERDVDKVKEILGNYCPPLGSWSTHICQLVYEGRDWDEWLYWYESDGRVQAALESRDKHGSSGGIGDISIFDALAIYYLGYEKVFGKKPEDYDYGYCYGEDQEDQGETDEIKTQEEFVLAKTHSEFMRHYGNWRQGVSAHRNNAGFYKRSEVSVFWKKEVGDKWQRLPESGESVSWASGYGGRENESATVAEQLESQPFNFVLIDYYAEDNESKMSGSPNNVFHRVISIIIVPDGSDLRARVRAVFQYRYGEWIDEGIFAFYGDKFVAETVEFIQQQSVRNPLIELEDKLAAMKKFDEAVAARK